MGNYTAQIEAYIKSGKKDIGAWLDTFPLGEQPEVMREFKKYAQDLVIEREDYQMATEIAEMEDGVDVFENAVIDVLAHQQQREKDDAALRDAWIERQMAYQNLCDKFRDGVLMQDENIESWVKLTKVVIDNQKKANAYDEEYWKPILHLLENPVQRKPTKKYTHKIETFMRKGNMDEQKWLYAFPLEEQPDVLRELMDYHRKQAIKNGRPMPPEMLAQLERDVADFEKATLEKIAILKKQDDREKEIQELRGNLEDNLIKIFDHTKEQILKNDEHQDQWIRYAREHIALLKEYNIYDEEYWKEVAHLL